MPTVDELLNASNEVTTCTINPDTREIIVPEKYKILGVFSDEKVTKIPFTCPRVVGNNVDLTEYNLYINYENAIGKSNAYLIEDVAVSGDNITFSWLLSRNVTVSPGVVKYSFCAKKLDGDTISNEWNTTIANGLVIQGLEATREIIEENPDIIEALISKAHTHENKAVLDKFSETDGKPTYDGEALGGGGGASDFIIKMTVESDDDGNYTVTSCDTTFEQINAAYNADKNIVLKVAASGYQGNGYFSLPVVSAAPGNYYYFCGLDDLYVYLAVLNRDHSEFSASNFSANNITYSNTALQNVKNVKAALDALVPKSHTHTNKDTLDKLSDSNGKLQYNGSDVGLKGDKGDKGDPGSDANVTKDNVVAALGYTPEAVSAQVSTGSNITLADNTEYRLTDVTTLTLTYPAGNFECWLKLTFASSGNVTVTLPAGTKYIGTAPDFKNGETWEMSIKDGVVIAQKVGDGT